MRNRRAIAATSAVSNIYLSLSELFVYIVTGAAPNTISVTNLSIIIKES